MNLMLMVIEDLGLDHDDNISSLPAVPKIGKRHPEKIGRWYFILSYTYEATWSEKWIVSQVKNGLKNFGINRIGAYHTDGVINLYGFMETDINKIEEDDK